MNLPNKLTVGRIVLVPFFVAALLIDFPCNYVVALLIFIAASITDMLDGKIARKRNLVTDFGKFADPLADKILVLALMIILLEQKSLLPGFAVTIILAREFIVTGFRIIAASKNVVIAAGWLGKIKTNLQFLMVILLLLNGTAPSTIGIFEIIIIIVIYATVALTVISGVEYIVKNIHVFNKEKGNE